MTEIEPRPEPVSEISQVKACVCPSFSLPSEPPRRIAGPVVSSSETVTLRDAELLKESPARSLSASVALTLISKTPRP